MTAIEAGADALGFVFYDKSPRCIAPEKAAEIIRALPPFVATVGLFVNAAADFVNSTAEVCRLDKVQLHGDESPEEIEELRGMTVIKSIKVVKK